MKRAWVGGLLGAWLLVGAVVPADARSARCESWSGELEGPPTSLDPDPFRSHWAVRRARELAAMAEELESRSRSLAAPLWRHAACLDPRRRDFAARARAATPAKVYRPPVLEVDHGHEFAVEADLAAPLHLKSRAGEAPLPTPPIVFASLRRAEVHLRDASFEEVLRWVSHGRSFLPAGRTSERGVQMGVRLEVLGATASLALGDEPGARAHLAAALAANPGLELDPASVSPKVIGLLAKVRGREEARR